MKTRIITVCLLFMHLLFAGCSKEEAIDNVDPDVPEVEIPEEEMEIVLDNMEDVKETISPIFMASETAADLSLQLKQINALEGVEDVWQEDVSTVCLKMVNGGIIAYFFPPEETDILNHSVLSEDMPPLLKSSNNLSCENKNVCIINQQSFDLNRTQFKPKYKEMAELYRASGFNVTEIDSEEFTLDFFCSSMPKYGIIFLVTHGGLIDGSHWFLTGEDQTDKDFITRTIFNAWYRGELQILSIKEKRMNWDNEGFLDVYYIAASEEYIKKNMADFSKNSILFNTACQSLKDGNDIWNILSSKNLGCYLGFDETNSVGKQTGPDFFSALLYDNKTVVDAYNSLPENLKIEKRPDTGTATLHCLPSDCQITLFGEPEVTDEEAVDLGLSVKWAKKNLGASNYTDKGNSYEDYDYMDIYYEDPILVGEDGEDVNLSGNEKYDYARKELGGSWRMPTFEDWQELKEKCSWKTVTIDDKPGFQVTGPNGNIIFLPAEKLDEPIMGIQHYDGLYATGTLNQVGLRSFYIVGSIAPYGINVCRIEDMWIANTASIRPVCD